MSPIQPAPMSNAHDRANTEQQTRITWQPNQTDQADQADQADQPHYGATLMIHTVLRQHLKCPSAMNKDEHRLINANKPVKD